MDIFDRILQGPSWLIAGKSGAGKSVLINGALIRAVEQPPTMTQLILIDPKLVELSWYRELPHCIAYASEHAEYISALMLALDKIQTRYEYMREKHMRKYDGGKIFVVIDELADLMTLPKTKKAVMPLIQRISQIGRACNVYMIMATQCPLASIIPTAIKVNCNCIGLKCRCAQDSRNIVGSAVCESLPAHGKGYCVSSDFEGYITIPYIDDTTVNRAISESMRKYSASRRIPITPVIPPDKHDDDIPPQTPREKKKRGGIFRFIPH